MRQWRVGTFSMGLLLFCTGIGLLYAQFQPLLVVESIFKWWPVIFIILGIEVLLQSYLKKGEESKIKYDIFSILIIFFIVMTGMGLQLAGKVGLSSYIQENISAEQYNIEMDREIALDKDIQKVVIEVDSGPRLKVRTGSEDSIQCNTQAEIRAQSEAEARQVMQEKNKLNSRRNGNTLYLSLGLSAGGDCYNVAYSLILPERLAVELEHHDASLQITAGQIAGDWLIRGDGYLDITLAPQSNLELYAFTSQALPLKGNLNWTAPDGQPLKVQPQQVDGELTEIDEASVQAQAKLGTGRCKMTIIHQGNEIRVNQLP
ncbi:MAG: hypothetical protein PHE26_04285 [Syntrophomonadaceae bacterium]|nr:hypothetical protein [Syntrophomonadaceae bacterium]